jgi:predicted dehydrogenase
VAQAYQRYAASDNGFSPDFASAVTRHALIDAIERSAAEGRAVRFSPSKVASPA